MHIHQLDRERVGVSNALIFEPGDEVIAALEAHARRAAIRAARFSAIGAFSQAVVAYFDVETKEYLDIPVDEQVEVASLIGNIGIHDGKPLVHAHCVLGRRDGSTVAGHLRKGLVRPTLELFLMVYDDSLDRALDAETGLPLVAERGGGATRDHGNREGQS